MSEYYVDGKRECGDTMEVTRRRREKKQEARRTLAVFNTPTRRGKSETPLSSVLTEDSRKESEVRSAATQSP